MHLYTKKISHKGDKIMTHLIYKKYKSFKDAKKDAKRQAFRIEEEKDNPIVCVERVFNPFDDGIKATWKIKKGTECYREWKDDREGRIGVVEGFLPFDFHNNDRQEGKGRFNHWFGELYALMRYTDKGNRISKVEIDELFQPTTDWFKKTMIENMSEGTPSL